VPSSDLFTGSSSDSMHSDASWHEDCKTTKKGSFSQAVLSDSELIVEHFPGPLKQHSSAANARLGSNTSNIARILFTDSPILIRMQVSSKYTLQTL
jgi:hypothetical protein